MRTWLTDRFGLTVPVVAAPMAGVSTGALAAAVTGAGGLGTIAVGPATTPERLREDSATARAGGAFGVGLLAWALQDGGAALVDAVVDQSPALVSVSYGPYARWVPTLQAAGIVVATQVGTLAEALAAQEAGVDLLVARGGEGGGHGRDDVATLPLLQSVLDAVELPVLAAGGVGTARGLAAVLAAGAVGAWVGTAFLACSEAATSEAARQRLVAADDTGTAYGRVFDVGQRLDWPPEYGGRALRNAFSARWAGREDLLATDDGAASELREARARGDFDIACIYAGQGVGLLRGERPASDVVAELARAGELLDRAAGRSTHD
ncbi:MAG: Enoyl-[acyl-carrier-protein] reductase [FMN] [uncultured Frankineae bacterium]|uniref:Enoyl-[acyl-carrier-protein] reductase [FMN] n=1 Tax=uncultured Frankineae bacterium TaxID=437475 RepID=A0A6J4L8J3_9ACTN|nr:MAG: Enoyl-[acyl-carrier-protein] reductase [FMN] [uncultured Frankineae bacterium]